MDLMKRDPFAEIEGPGQPGHRFHRENDPGPQDGRYQIWSKAGWTNKSRHDAAYIETPDGLKFVLVDFTENHANEQEVIPTIAGKIVDGCEQQVVRSRSCDGVKKFSSINSKRLPTKINLRRTDMKILPFRFAAVTLALHLRGLASHSAKARTNSRRRKSWTC